VIHVLRVLAQQYLKAAWRRRWLGVAVAWLVCAVGWVAVFLIPNQFESSARLYVDGDLVLTPLLRGLTIDTGPVSQLDMLQRTLLSRPNLEKLVSKTDLDLSVKSPSDRERLVASLASDIRVIPQTRNLFTITYRDPNPRTAHDVVQTLLTIFVESATGGSRSDMENARRFLEHQISSYEQQLRAAEKRRIDFRYKYGDMLPADNGNGPLTALEAARGQIRSLESQLQDATVRRDKLAKEVASTPPLVVVEKGGPMDPTGNPQLRAAEEQLHALLFKFTDEHPDVIAQRKLIEFLKKSPNPDAKAPPGQAAAGGTTTPLVAGQRSLPNPVYEQVKLRLVDAEGAVASLQRQREDTIASVARLEKIQHDQPGLMAEYQNMDRDYGVLRRNYEELLGRLESANMSQAAETQADKVKLDVIDPPEVPRLPVAPKRLMMISGVLLAGLGVGAAFTILLGQLEQTFATVDDLRKLGLPVLGGISIVGLVSMRNRILTVARFGLAVSVLLVIYGGLVVHNLRSAALI
jgi:polysaccharide chain length determinant protein (PEP-CTERM system associated)